MNRFLKFAALTLALPLFLSTYSSADSFTFTGRQRREPIRKP